MFSLNLQEKKNKKNIKENREEERTFGGKINCDGQAAHTPSAPTGQLEENLYTLTNTEGRDGIADTPLVFPKQRCWSKVTAAPGMQDMGRAQGRRDRRAALVRGWHWKAAGCWVGPAPGTSISNTHPGIRR